MKKTIYIVSSIWMILVSISFLWNYINAKNEQKTVAFQAARSSFDQIVMIRAWNAGHSGVYVPITKNTQPNPYLEDPLRDIEINDNFKLTKVNPAFMTRQIAEIASKREGILFHITSLNPIRPENRPTIREETALKSFESGIKEVGEIININSNSYIFYMAPLITEKECLKCHTTQGYKEGDIRGGISIILPFIPKIPFMTLMLGHIGISLFGIIGIVIFGITLNKAYETIQRQAVIDALTGIPNRRSFSEQLLREFRRSKRDKYPLSIIMCDVDNFKSYNDTYGHLKGDECLKAVAKVIDKSVNRPSDFCARYGGEEFVVILPNTAQKGAVDVAEKIRTNVQKMGIEHIKSLPLQVVSLSLGVTSMETKTSMSHEELVNKADKALYMAKEKGRNRIEVFSENV
jgi:diguanylate cyclase (GGDEF)-like protein